LEARFCGLDTDIEENTMNARSHAHHGHHAQHAPGRSRYSHAHAHHAAAPQGLNRLSFVATLHCLSGCAIGEVLGMVIGTALGWSDSATIGLAVALAFTSGYLMTMLPLLRAGMPLGHASKLALAADSASIAIMEIVDNAVMLVLPGAMDAPLSSGLFWGSLALALLVAGIAAFPVNRWLIARGNGHAVVHAHHTQH
jgi:hypothetical protein